MGFKMLKRLDNSVFYMALGIVLAFAINWGLAFGLSTDMPVVAVESNSMLPAFSMGDMLVLQGVPAQSLKVNDIIVFSPSPQQTPVVHRIISINPDNTFQTKGDNNQGQLPFELRIEPSQIHGKAIFIIPYAGWLKLGMMQYVLPNILWVIVGAGLIAFIYIGIKMYWGEGFGFW